MTKILRPKLPVWVVVLLNGLVVLSIVQHIIDFVRHSTVPHTTETLLFAGGEVLGVVLLVMFSLTFEVEGKHYDLQSDNPEQPGGESKSNGREVLG